jgi:hypothetical protein
MDQYPESAPFSNDSTSYVSAAITDPDTLGLFAQIQYYLSLVPPDEGHNCYELRQLMDREHSNISARLRQMELRGLVKKIDVWRPGETGDPSQCYTNSNGIPPGIAVRIPRHNIDWTTKPLGPLDWAILQSLPATDANIAEGLERTEQAVSGNRRHLVERGFVIAIDCAWNDNTQRPNIVWGLTDRGRQLLAGELIFCGHFGFISRHTLRRYHGSPRTNENHA